MSTYSIILAGGSGTRLWPLSRRLYPKQFIAFDAFGGRSLFQMSVLRALHTSRPEHLIVVTSADYKFHCMTQIEELGVHVDESQILTEPLARNTLGAITYGMRALPADDDLALILPSDHIIGDDERFAEIIARASEHTRDRIITFGIAPTEAHTGYGYIAPVEAGAAVSPVRAFHEKPTLEKANEYIAAGYIWNAGIFLMSRKTFMDELQRHRPEYADLWQEGDIAKIFASLPDLSIDHGIMERSDRISVVPIDIMWSDLGSFTALHDYLRQAGVRPHDTIEVDSTDNFVHSTVAGKTIALVGIKDCIVIDTPDAILVAKASEAQKIRAVVDTLKARKHPAADVGETIYRPWGSYTVIDSGAGFKTKRITVLPGKTLSLQFHHHRSEHWVVVSGTASVRIGDSERILAKGESVYIPTGVVHRLANPGKVALHLIESQVGDYLEEDDIVRLEDRYGRA